jgi:hypothetical protein
MGACAPLRADIRSVEPDVSARRVIISLPVLGKAPKEGIDLDLAIATAW